jgi:hypothetical protein
MRASNKLNPLVQDRTTGLSLASGLKCAAHYKLRGPSKQTAIRESLPGPFVLGPMGLYTTYCTC